MLASPLLALIVATLASAQNTPGPITVFVAKKIITIDPTWPVATAVAVRDGRILGVGSLQDLQPWLKSNKYTVDEQFKDKVLMPGLIDPHLQQEDRIGGIEAGKLADFAVLDKDPYEVGAAGLRDIKVWGTVFEGKAYLARKSSH